MDIIKTLKQGTAIGVTSSLCYTASGYAADLQFSGAPALTLANTSVHTLLMVDVALPQKSTNGQSTPARQSGHNPALEDIANAEYLLGISYAENDEPELALYWLKKAASKGHKAAQFSYHYLLDADDDLELGC